MTEKNLKACPFCGERATTSDLEGLADNQPKGCGWVGCQFCRVHIDWMNGERGKILAFEAWNNRV